SPAECEPSLELLKARRRDRRGPETRQHRAAGRALPERTDRMHGWREAESWRGPCEFESRFQFEGDEFVQTAGAEAVQVESDELEAKAAELASQIAANRFAGQAGQLREGHFDPREVAVM